MSAPQVNIRMTGDKELIELMSKLPAKFQQRLVKEAILPALESVKNKAISNVMGLSVNAPTDRLRKAIASKIKVEIVTSGVHKTKGKVAVFYGVSGRERKGELKDRGLLASVAHLIEYGFKLTYYFGFRIPAQRIPAQPFMQPAFDSERAHANAVFMSVLRDSVETAGLK